MDTIGKRLKHALFLLRMSNAQLANELGVSRQSVTNWVKSDYAPNKELAKLLHSKGIDLTWLLKGEGKPFSDSPKGKILSEYNDYKGEGMDVVSFLVREKAQLYSSSYIPDLESMTIKEIRAYYNAILKVLPEIERIIGNVKEPDNEI